MKLNRNLLALAVASVLAGMSTAGFSADADQATATNQAQPADAAQAKKPKTPDGSAENQATEFTTIQVTGIRHSIETAIETKQQATSIVEAVSSEDLGKLPDISIAESISRLPG